LALPLAFAESHQHFPDPTALTLLCAQGAQWAQGHRGRHGLIMPRNPLGLPPQKPAIDFVLLD